MQVGPDNLWLVALIAVLVLVAVNVVTLGVARGARHFKGKDYFNLGNATRPWKKEENDLRELSQRVQELKAKQKDE
jgi:hypothetical protein